MSYKIVRMYFNDGIPSRTIKRGLTLKEAQTYCQSPESSSLTATSRAATARTKRVGPWFDGFQEIK